MCTINKRICVTNAYIQGLNLQNFKKNFNFFFFKLYKRKLYEEELDFEIVDVKVIWLMVYFLILKTITLLFSVPSVSVEGQQEKHVMAGSPVQLKCFIKNCLKQPSYVFW